MKNLFQNLHKSANNQSIISVDSEKMDDNSDNNKNDDNSDNNKNGLVSISTFFVKYV